VYAAAVLDRLVASSPVVRVSLPRDERERVTPLSVDQVKALAAAMPLSTQAMVLTQAGLGLRLGDLLALRVEDVDFLKRSVRVEWKLEAAARRRVPPKTPRSRRMVPLLIMVAEALEAHIGVNPPLVDGTLFYNTAQHPWHANHYGTRMFAKAVQLSGCPRPPRHTTCGTTTRRCCWPAASRWWRSLSGSATRTRRWC
jgi:integrase